MAFLISIYLPLNAQNKPSPEYQVKAAFLYNFTRFINWPSATFSSDGAPFVIGILGNDPFGTYLDETVKDELVDDHPIIIQHYKNESDITNCHILFVNTTDAVRIKQVLAYTRQKSILTVSDAASFTKWGGIMRFFKEQNKVKLQINIVSAKASRLEISSKLLSLATIYNSGEN